MNIFQQVFANANQNKPPLTNIPLSQQSPPAQTQLSSKPKSPPPNDLSLARQSTKPNTNQATVVSFDLRNTGNIQNQKKEINPTIIEKKPVSIASSNAGSTIRKKKETAIESSLKNKLEAIQKKVSDMELKLNQKEQDLKGMKEKNEHLRLQKQEKEIYIEKMNAAVDELNKKIIQMQDDFDQEDDEKSKYWEFKYMELKFQIETLKEESAQ